MFPRTAATSLAAASVAVDLNDCESCKQKLKYSNNTYDSTGLHNLNSDSDKSKLNLNESDSVPSQTYKFGTSSSSTATVTSSELTDFNVSSLLKNLLRLNNFSSIHELVECQNKPGTVHIDRSDIIRKSSTALSEVYDFDISKSIGEGGYGSVFVVTHKLTGLERAAKRIPKSTFKKGDWEMLENEIKSMMDLDHPHICRLYEYYEDNDDIFLILEMCHGGDLFDRILAVLQDPKKKRFGEYESGVLLRHMLKAIFCCHSSGIVHRDIKPENFMFKDKDKTMLKMIDLGLAARGKCENVEQMMGMSGTIAYMPPEMLTGEHYNRTCDIWSLGIVLYIMLVGEPLFSLSGDDQVVMKQILNPRFVENKFKRLMKRKDLTLSKEAIDILEKMLDRDPKRRIQAKDALSHPFIMRTYMAESSENSGSKRSKSGKSRGSNAESIAFSRSSSILSQDSDNSNILKMSEVLSRMKKFSELPLLKRTALITLAHMIGTSSSFEELEKCRLTFRVLDLDGGGSISFDEFKEGIKRESGEDLLDPDFESTIWRAVDMNASDDINFTEFLAACMVSNSNTNDNSTDLGYGEKHWRAVFRILDYNNSKKLDMDDLVEMFPETEKKELENMLKEVSGNGKEWLDEEDFVKMMMN